MKTTQFGTLKFEATYGGEMMLKAFSPTMGHFELPMSADELMIFLVEAGNSLSEGRREELKRRQDLELIREEQR